MLEDIASLAVSGVAALVSAVSSIYLIWHHLKHYTKPTYQRYIVRIVFMVPTYGLMSWLSLVFRNEEIYFDTIRDCYEAWVIYNFLSLCLAYVGQVINKMEGRFVPPSWTTMTCCMKAMPINGLFLRRCKQGVLQFVLLKPVLAIVSLWLEAAGLLEDGDFRVNRGYMYIVIVYNFSYMFALFELLLFYVGTHELMAPFNPLFKFIVVKSVIFLTFWQSIFISLMVTWTWVPTPDDGKALQNFIICLEMAGFGFMMMIAFPYQDYIKTGFDGKDEMSLASNISHAMSVKDVAADTVHQFTTKYNAYTLYHDGGQKVEGKKLQNVVKASIAKDRMEYIEEEEEEPQGLLAHDSMAEAHAEEDVEAGHKGSANGGAGPSSGAGGKSSGKGGKAPSPKPPAEQHVGPLAGLDSDDESDEALEGPDEPDDAHGHGHGDESDKGPQEEEGFYSYDKDAKVVTEDLRAIKSTDEEAEDRKLAVHL